MMTLKTGSNSRLLRIGGFSLMELLIAVSFVLLGSVVIQGSFLRAADMFGRYSHTLKIRHWMDEATAEAKRRLLYTKDSLEGDEEGTLTIDEKSFDWSRKVEPVTDKLFKIRSEVSWKEGGRPLVIKSELYVYKKEI